MTSNQYVEHASIDKSECMSTFDSLGNCTNSNMIAKPRNSKTNRKQKASTKQIDLIDSIGQTKKKKSTFGRGHLNFI